MDASKKGFLTKDFDIFYINDKKGYEYEYHFHEFHKLIIFLKGNVNYIIEGKGYQLQPYDILIVRNNEIHKPEISSEFPYERIVIWINDTNLFKQSEYLELLECFKSQNPGTINLLRFGEDLTDNFCSVIEELKKTFTKNHTFGKELLRRALFVQIMVYVNRKVIRDGDNNSIKKYANFDKSIQKAIEYIDNNLKNDLSVDKIAENLFLSKYHLMRKFKQYTGYTLHYFILNKRLIRSKELIKSGKSAYNASVEVGFADYSTFVRAYKKLFKELPSKQKNKHIE